MTPVKQIEVKLQAEDLHIFVPFSPYSVLISYISWLRRTIVNVMIGIVMFV